MSEQPNKKQKNRFTCREGILLLRETLAVNPYKAKTFKELGRKWTEVLRNFMILCPTERTVRSVREHVEYLLHNYNKKDFHKLRRSGTELEYNQKEQLLEKIKVLKSQHKELKKHRKMKSKDVEPTKSKSKRDSLFSMIKETMLKDIELEHRRVTLEEKREENESRRIAVEEQKAINEARRLALDERKQDAFEIAQKQQQELMSLLIQKIR